MLRPKARSAAGAAPWIVVLASSLAACSQESADRAANAVERAPAQVERQTERAAAVLDDATITAKVKSALIADPDAKAYAIDVDTQRNVVTLNGTVANEDASKRAEAIARRVDGVKDVKNNLLAKGA